MRPTGGPPRANSRRPLRTVTRANPVAAVPDGQRLGRRPHPPTPLVQHRCDGGVLGLVRTVGRQIAERGADALDRLADAGHFVCAEVIGDDDVPGMQGGHEDLFDIGEEARPVDGAVEDPGRGQASHPQRCEKRTGLPPGARRVVVDAGPAEGPTIPPQEIVRNAGFIEKNQTCRIPGRRGGVPHDPRGRDVRSIVFGGPDRFF